MDRGTLVGVALVLLGIALVATAPPDPQFSMSVYTEEAPDDEPVVAYENLSTEEQQLFSEALSDGHRSANPPEFEAEYVAYEGETYRVATYAHEGPVLSLLMPPLGGVVALVGILAVAYVRLYRS